MRQKKFAPMKLIDGDISINRRKHIAARYLLVPVNYLTVFVTTTAPGVREKNTTHGVTTL